MYVSMLDYALSGAGKHTRAMLAAWLGAEDQALKDVVAAGNQDKFRYVVSDIIKSRMLARQTHANAQEVNDYTSRPDVQQNMAALWSQIASGALQNPSSFPGLSSNQFDLNVLDPNTPTISAPGEKYDQLKVQAAPPAPPATTAQMSFAPPPTGSYAAPPTPNYGSPPEVAPAPTRTRARASTSTNANTKYVIFGAVTLAIVGVGVLLLKKKGSQDANYYGPPPGYYPPQAQYYPPQAAAPPTQSAPPPQSAPARANRKRR
jgi:hypothetical protein